MIAISILVHEKPECILDQIINIKRFVPNSVIVLHVSKVFYENNSDDSFANMDGVYINPMHYMTKWGDIILPHISNFEFISKKTNFDYFLMHSSNDMYIKEGLEDYVKKFEAGFQIRKVIQKYSDWWPADISWKDFQIQRICRDCGQSMKIASQIEGSFYKKDIMQRIVDVIKNNYLSEESVEKYTREEFYFSTVASSFVDWSRIGRPTTFSEVHRFDRFLWSSRNRLRRAYKLFFHFLIPQHLYNNFERCYNAILFRTKFYRIRKSDIRRLLNNPKKVIDKNRFLNDGSGYFNLYDADNIFSVKRVNRKYKDSVRKYIRKITNKAGNN